MVTVNGKVLSVKFEKAVAEMITYRCKYCHHQIEIQQDLFDMNLLKPNQCTLFDGGCGHRNTGFEMQRDLSQIDSKHIITVSGDRKRYIIWMDELSEPPIRGDNVSINIINVRAKRNTKATFHAVGSSIEID
jgi:DNA replicative helicase MCM subunit Mcm2 (Cdc46/Mcm family)